MIPSRNRQAYSLVEIVIALAIAAFVSIGFLGSIVYTLRESATNRAHLQALMIADYYQGLVLAADYVKLGKTDLSAGDFEVLFNRGSDNPLTVNSDPTYTEVGQEFQLFFELTGFGSVEEAGGSSLKAVIPSNQANWAKDEWKGNYVTIVAGPGAGQIMRITGNTENTLTVTSDLTGASSEGWAITPTAASRYVINNGKTVRVRVNWQDGTDHQSIARTVLLRHRAGG